MPGISVLILVDADPTTIKSIGVGANVLGIDDCECECIFCINIHSHRSVLTSTTSQSKPS